VAKNNVTINIEAEGLDSVIEKANQLVELLKEAEQVIVCEFIQKGNVASDMETENKMEVKIMLEDKTMQSLKESEELKKRKVEEEAYANKMEAITGEVMRILRSNGLSVNDVNKLINVIQKRLAYEAHL